MSGEKGISIIICCYNSAKRITPALDHVFRQTLSPALSCELIVVDNASTDDTGKLVQQYFQTRSCGIPCRVVEEQQPGLSHARQKGLSEARYGYLLYVDDDNWLDPNYVSRAFDIMEASEAIGVLGGYGEALCETEPPEWFPRFTGSYAVGEQAPVSSGTGADTDWLYGAGIVFRRSALEKIKQAGFSNKTSGRKGKALLSGEDTELCLAAGIAGYRIRYDRRLTFRHLISRERLTWNYLEKLFTGFGRSRTYMELYLHCKNGTPHPSLHSRLPLWLDRWIHLARTAGRYRNCMFKSLRQREGDASCLEWLALKGQLLELWKLKGRYDTAYREILGFTQHVRKQQ
jgi:glycosyltransferase involved in cell wall biosynthesis